jgi:hypothetical protein
MRSGPRQIVRHATEFYMAVVALMLLGHADAQPSAHTQATVHIPAHLTAH